MSDECIFIDGPMRGKFRVLYTNTSRLPVATAAEWGTFAGAEKCDECQGRGECGPASYSEAYAVMFPDMKWKCDKCEGVGRLSDTCPNVTRYETVTYHRVGYGVITTNYKALYPQYVTIMAVGDYSEDEAGRLFRALLYELEFGPSEQFSKHY